MLLRVFGVWCDFRLALHPHKDDTMRINMRRAVVVVRSSSAGLYYLSLFRPSVVVGSTSGYFGIFWVLSSRRLFEPLLRFIATFFRALVGVLQDVMLAFYGPSGRRGLCGNSQWCTVDTLARRSRTHRTLGGRQKYIFSLPSAQWRANTWRSDDLLAHASKAWPVFVCPAALGCHRVVCDSWACVFSLGCTV